MPIQASSDKACIKRIPGYCVIGKPLSSLNGLLNQLFNDRKIISPAVVLLRLKINTGPIIHQSAKRE